jgi:hypothetical protein
MQSLPLVVSFTLHAGAMVARIVKQASKSPTIPRRVHNFVSSNHRPAYTRCHQKLHACPIQLIHGLCMTKFMPGRCCE